MLMRFNPAKPVKTAAEQGSEFWLSPWSVVTEWWRPEGNGQPAVRSYREGRRVVIEVELPGQDPAQMSLEAGPERLHLVYGSHDHTVPLPFRVAPETVKAEWRHGLLRVEGQPAGGGRRLSAT